MEISNLPSKEFKVMIIKMLNELRRTVDKHRENQVLENTKKNQTELRITITEISKYTGKREKWEKQRHREKEIDYPKTSSI